MSDVESIHACAQHGDVDGVRAHLDSGVDVHARDDNGVTPLHWAAINGHIACCALLLARGADVNCSGGTLNATPMHWCTRQGQLHVMSFLLEHGADPLRLDGQGYHALHLATHSSLVMSLVFLLQLDAFQACAALDRPDSQGHTALMWAAFQGDALSVDVLLQHGADVHLADMDGLTPLHWAAVHGNRLCVRYIVEAGGELSAREHKGKTPAELARELGTYNTFQSALKLVDKKDDGTPVRFWISRRNANILVCVLPYFMYGATFMITGRMPWYFAPATFVFGIFATHVFINAFLLRTDHTKGAQASPYFASLLVMTIAHGFLHYVAFLSGYSLLRDTAIGVLITAIIYFFFLSVTRSPSKCARVSKTEVRDVVVKLARDNELNGANFCAACMARKPLRAKHCTICKTCVARFDHHCPWIMNCVGLHNHAVFIAGLASAVLGIALVEWSIWMHFVEHVTPASMAQLPTHRWACPVPWACAAVAWNGSLFYTGVWLLITEVWITFLLGSQVYQVSRQMTTFEFINVSRHGYMGGRADGHMLGQGQAGYIKLQSEHLQSQGLSPKQAKLLLRFGTHERPSKCSALLSGPRALAAIVGVNLSTRQPVPHALKGNPFDHGFVGNWLDFLSRGKRYGIDYTHLYHDPS